MTADETKTMLALLVQLAKADGTVDLKEDFFIKLFAHNNSVDPGEFDRICRSPEMYARNLGSLTDKEDVFVRLCSFVYFDMKADDAELEWCRNVGRQLDLSATKVDEVISTIQTSDAPLSVQELTELVKA
ncbi:MAG: hypothetical protein GC178_06680 [Flavobacteriales bacterium]|nr:hypothetical protein [Flavobacteriales bacterium]